MSFTKPDIVTVNTLLASRIFRIPDYQRPYSWGTKQLKALFNDIKNAAAKDKEHFMSTIVYVKTSKKEVIGSNEFYYHDVVDGQQRLTSVIILLKAIQKKLSSQKADEQTEKQMLQESILVRGKTKQLVLLQTNHNERLLLNGYLQDTGSTNGQEPKTLPEKNLMNAFTESENFVESWRSEGRDIIELLGIIKNKLLFLVYDISDESISYTVFDVLNSRGLPVIYLDKAKSLFLSHIYTSDMSDANKALYADSVKSSWTKIYDLMGLREFDSDDILKYAATFLSEDTKAKFVSAEDSLSVFEEIFADPTKIEETARFLVTASEHLKTLYSNSVLKFFSSITQLRFFYVAVQLSGLTADDKNEVLGKWQDVSFIIYGLYGKDSKYSVGDFVRLAKEIYDGTVLANKDMNEQEKRSFEALSLKDKIIARLKIMTEEYPLGNIQDEFEGRNCYKDWYDELKYLLYRVELFFAAKKASGRQQPPQKVWNDIFELPIQDTVEHIIPETRTDEWSGKVGKGNKYDKVVNRLGNLLLLPQGLNSECKQKSFGKKKEIYKRAKLFIADDVIYSDEENTTERTDWDFSQITERENRYFAIIKELFA